MRVLVAPNAFAGSLSAVAAGAAIAEGWRQRRPGDQVTVVPVSDGGPGFVSALAGLGEARSSAVEGPFAERVDVSWLVLPDGTAVVESAQACGRHLGVGPLEAATAGVGELVCLALDVPGIRRVVVGVGGTGSTDAGAGAASALGAWLLDGSGHPVPPGGGGLSRLDRVDLADLDPRLPSVEFVVAADVDNVLCGPDGAAAAFAPQKGASEGDVEALEAALRRWAAVVERDVPGAEGVAARPHSGAGGGLAAGLMAFCRGAARPGAGFVLEALKLSRKVALADLVVTGEGAFDWQTLRGKAPAAVAALAQKEGVPCLVVAGQVEAGRREMASAGVDAAYAVADLAGSVEEALAEPAGWLADLAGHVAGEWSR